MVNNIYRSLVSSSGIVSLLGFMKAPYFYLIKFFLSIFFTIQYNIIP